MGYIIHSILTLLNKLLIVNVFKKKILGQFFVHSYVLDYTYSDKVWKSKSKAFK